MARGSAQNAKGNKANNQPASAKGAGSHLRANKGHEADFDDFEPWSSPRPTAISPAWSSPFWRLRPSLP
ncbi:MAG: hypothetical protein ACLU0O_05710 [Collinsella sp.]